MEPKPFRSPPLSQDSGGGGGTHKREGEERTVVMEGKKKTVKEGSPSIKCCENAVLTPAQFFEFQRQGLIFEHMKAGLPVPRHVWIPIWKDVASSFGSDRSGIYKLYPSFAGLGLPQKVDRKVDHLNMMDLEPGRCRRTDGNKWRCGKNAVHDQKYCERHMYRGCSRSRKHVEASKVANPLGKNSSKDSDNLKAISVHSQNDPNPQSLLPLTLITPCDSKNSKTNGTFSQGITPSSSNTSSVTTTGIKNENKNDSMFVGESNSNIVRGKNFDITIDAADNTNHTYTIPTMSISTITSRPITVNITINDTKNDVIDYMNTAADSNLIPSCNPMTHSCPSFVISNSTNINKENNARKIIRSSKSGNNAIMGNNVSTGYDFSRKRVLHVLGCRSSGFYRRDVELEGGRCGRTDGKKWRCSRDVVPNQKYCDMHMHRGAKKRVEAKHPVAKSTTVTTSSTCLPRAMTTSSNADSANSNTILSESFAETPQVATISPASSSSDATISDTTITANEDN